LTLQQLAYFLAAFRHGSFSGAADELYMAQPSLSEQVRRLEAELGVALFQRVGRGLVPSEAGLTLRPHAERTLADAEAARESVVAVRELRGGIATFGTWGTARHYPGTDIVAEKLSDRASDDSNHCLRHLLAFCRRAACDVLSSPR